MTRPLMMAALAFAICASPASAQPATLRLTVDEAVARAFEASHRLAEGRARQDAADATRLLRQAQSRPIATASAAYTRTNHVEEFGFPRADGTIRVFYPDVPDNYITRLAAQWPIYTAGRTDALERAAAAESRAAGADIETTRADLRFEVRRAYWAVATSREAVRVLEESVARADAQLGDARQRLDVGLVPPSDVLSFEAARSREELQLIEAVNQRESALVELRRLVGADPEAAIELAEPLDAAPAFPELAAAGPSARAPSIPRGLVLEALDSRPERSALAFRIESARARQDSAAAGGKPTLALGAGVDLANPNPKIFPREEKWQSSWDVGVNLTWTLFDGGRTRAERSEASASTRAIEARLNELDTLVAADVRQRVLDLRSSLASVRAAADGVRAATEARRVLGERFTVGVATTTDVLIAQDQLLAAELARTRALAGVRLAEARLQRALGRP